MSLPQFTKVNIESTKGRQAGKYDGWLAEFKQPGDALQFDECDLAKHQAASIARRFRELTDKPFHSFFDVKTRKVTIRLRHPNELGGNQEELDLDDEDNNS